MSSAAGILVNPANGVREQIWNGFSWPCLLFGALWFVYKRLYGWALISFVIAIATSGISWLVFPFFANNIHRNSLLKQGWLGEDQAREFIVSPDTHVRCPECKELVRMDARICKHCHAKLVPMS